MDFQESKELSFDTQDFPKEVWVFDADNLDQGTEISHLMMSHAEQYTKDELLEICRQASMVIDQLRVELAKAQAVPEGFALVKKVHPDAIVHNQGLGLFKECQIIYGWDGKSKDFKDALNKGFYHGVKLGAKAVLETAMIEAQEPAND